MRARGAAPDARARRRADGATRPRTRRARCRSCSSAASSARSSSARRCTCCATRWFFRRSTARRRRAAFRAARFCRRRGALAWELGRASAWSAARSCGPREAELEREPAMSDTLVFIPAWNEEDNLPAVLDELHAELPDADVLVVDDGSTDRTADVAREHGAEVLSFGENRGPAGRDRRRLRAGRSSTATRSAAASTPTASIPPPSWRGCSRSCATGECDVAVGSRFVVRRRLRARTATCRARRGASARRCCGARWSSCCGGRSATRRAACTPSTRRRSRCSRSRSRAARRRSRR